MVVEGPVLEGGAGTNAPSPYECKQSCVANIRPFYGLESMVAAASSNRIIVGDTGGGHGRAETRRFGARTNWRKSPAGMRSLRLDRAGFSRDDDFGMYLVENLLDQLALRRRFGESARIRAA